MPKPRNPFDLAERLEARRQSDAAAVAEKRRPTPNDDFARALAAQTAPGPAPVPTDCSLSLAALCETGAVLRVPAGGAARLTINGLAGWTHHDVFLRLSPHAEKTALPLSLPHATPGPSGYAASRALPLSPPIFVQSLVFQYVNVPQSVVQNAALQNDRLEVTAETETTQASLTRRQGRGFITPVKTLHIGAHVSALALQQSTNHQIPFQIAAILPNRAEGVSLAQDDERVLHQVPRKLVFGDEATTADLSDVLNRDEDVVTLLIKARSDCTLALKGRAKRRRLVTGADPALAQPLWLTPWRPITVQPRRPSPAQRCETTLTAKGELSGGAALSLCEPAPRGACQRVLLPRRAALAQPLLLPASERAARVICGAWLMLAEPPKTQVQLCVQITGYDPTAPAPTHVLAEAQVTVPPKGSALGEVRAGILRFWVPFEEPLSLEAAQAETWLALALFDLSATLPLLECPRTRPSLGAALWRDVSHSERWQQRDFGTPDKALLFDLGEDRGPGAEILVQAQDTSTSLKLARDKVDLSVSLANHGRLTLHCARSLRLEEVRLCTTTDPEILGE